MQISIKEKLAQIKNKLQENPGESILVATALTSAITAVVTVIVKNIIESNDDLKLDIPRAWYDDVEAGKCDAGLFVINDSEYILEKNRHGRLSQPVE